MTIYEIVTSMVLCAICVKARMPLTCLASVSIVIHKHSELVCIVNEMLVMPLCHVFVMRSHNVKENLVEEIDGCNLFSGNFCGSLFSCNFCGSLFSCSLGVPFFHRKGFQSQILNLYHTVERSCKLAISSVRYLLSIAVNQEQDNIFIIL